MPALEAAYLDGEDRDLLAVLKLVEPVSPLWSDPGERSTQPIQTGCAHFFVAALDDGAAHLPVVEAVDEHQEQPASHAGGKRLLRIALAPREPEPEHVDRRGYLDRIESRQPAHLREAAVRADRQRGANLAPAVPPPVAHAPHHPVLLEELLHPGPHGESEVRVALRLLSNELQETRLGHHHYVGEPCPQSREEVEGELPTFGRHGKVPDLRVAELEEAIG